VQLSGKQGFVTGGASGIAAGTVAAFVREGASVVSMDVNDEAGIVVAKEFDAAGPASMFYQHCDVTDQTGSRLRSAQRSRPSAVSTCLP
jgi:NAD(P)-dependent dehydrogenase (short-subunit alcohol dehydrogenase family)